MNYPPGVTQASFDRDHEERAQHPPRTVHDAHEMTETTSGGYKLYKCRCGFKTATQALADKHYAAAVAERDRCFEELRAALEKKARKTA